jgi:hypothetical protein
MNEFLSLIHRKKKKKKKKKRKKGKKKIDDFYKEEKSVVYQKLTVSSVINMTFMCCNHQNIITDYHAGDMVCTGCGLVHEASIIDDRAHSLFHYNYETLIKPRERRAKRPRSADSDTCSNDCHCHRYSGSNK